MSGRFSILPPSPPVTDRIDLAQSAGCAIFVGEGTRTVARCLTPGLVTETRAPCAWLGGGATFDSVGVAPLTASRCQIAH